MPSSKWRGRLLVFSLAVPANEAVPRYTPPSPFLTTFREALLPLGEAGWGFQRGHPSLHRGALLRWTNNLSTCQPIYSSTLPNYNFELWTLNFELKRSLGRLLFTSSSCDTPYASTAQQHPYNRADGVQLRMSGRLLDCQELIRDDGEGCSFELHTHPRWLLVADGLR